MSGKINRGCQAGRGRYGAARPPRKRKSMFGKLFFALITFLNLLLSVLLLLLRRQEVLQAVEKDGRVKVMLSSQKSTKS